VAVGADGRWEAAIGDPTVVGWVTVGFYAVAALLALRCARRAALPLEFRFWTVATLVLVLLGINKQLDLQTLIVQIGRDVAFQQGWYDRRREAQAVLIAALTIGGVAMAVLLYWFARRLPAPTRLATTALVLLTAFIVLRGVSFHHVDQIVGSNIEGIRYNWILELTPLTLFIVAAWRRRAVDAAAEARGSSRAHDGRRSRRQRSRSVSRG
jgi:hypothetical protein